MTNLNDIEPKVDSPELAAYFAQFGKATYVSAEDINTIVANLKLALKNSGMPLESNLGLLKTTDTPPATGKHKGDVATAGTYTNFKDSNAADIVFSQAEIDANFAYIYVVNNVSSKILLDKKGGESAYQIAVNNGYVGTEAQWLNSLKGTAKIVTWTAIPFASGTQVIKDGKVYENNVATVGTDVPGVSSKWVEKAGVTVANKPKKNIYDSSKNITGFYLNTSGLLSASTNSIYAKIPVKPSTSYVISKNSSFSASAFSQYVIKDISDVTLVSSGLQTLTNETAGLRTGKIITTPATASYIIINIYSDVAGGYPSLSSLLQIEEGSNSSIYETYIEQVVGINGKEVVDENARSRIKNLENAPIIVPTVLSTEPEKNLYSSAHNITGFYVKSTGVAADATSIYAKIPIKSETNYVITTDVGIATGAFVGYIFRDSLDVEISKGGMNLLDIENGDRNGRKFKSPVNAAFMLVTIYSTVAGGYPNLSAVLQLEEGLSSTTYEVYTPVVKTINTFKLKDIVSRTRLNNLDSYNLLKNINVAICGDSISGQTIKWAQVLTDKKMFKKITNVARSGARWSHQAATVYDTTLDGSGNNVMWNQANNIIAQVTALTLEAPNVVYIMCGRNDANFSIGDIPTTFTGTILDRAPGTILTVSEGIRYTCETLLQAFPNVQIILGTPLQWVTDTGLTTIQMADGIKTCARYISAKVIDVAAESGICNKLEEGSNHKYLVDGTHPNLAGATKLGNYIANQFRLKVIR